MEPQQAPQGQKKAAEALRAEMERRSKDSFKVYNPTNQDYQVVLNAAISPEIWTVESHGEAIVPRYVREKYFEEMVKKIITARSDKAIIEENEKRMKAGFPKLDLHTEQYRLESRNLKIMQSKEDKILKILDRGLYKEYGVEKTGTHKIDDRDARANFKIDSAVDEVLGVAPIVPQVATPIVADAPVVENPPVGTGTVASNPANQPQAEQVVPNVVEEPDEDDDEIL